jgi:hypothetical protein
MDIAADFIVIMMFIANTMNHLETFLCSLHQLINIILNITGHCILTYINAPDVTVTIVVDNQGI